MSISHQSRAEAAVRLPEAGRFKPAAAPRRSEVPGIPRDPDIFPDILLERGLAVPSGKGGPSRRYWRLAPEPLARGAERITLTLLRLASPDLVLAGAVPAPVAVIPQQDQRPPSGAAAWSPKDPSGAAGTPWPAGGGAPRAAAAGHRSRRALRRLPETRGIAVPAAGALLAVLIDLVVANAQKRL